MSLLLLFRGVAAGAALAASVDATATLSADLTVPAISGVQAGGALYCVRRAPTPLPRVRPLFLHASALNINGEILLASVQATNATVTGAVSVDKPLAAAVAGGVTMGTPVVTVEKPLTCDVIASGSGTATLTVDKPLAASAPATASLSGAFELVSAALASSATATAVSAGAVSVDKPLAASVTVTAAHGATLTSDTGAQPPVARGMLVVARNRADLRRVQTAGALFLGGLDVSASSNPLAASMTVTATMSGTATVAKPLAGAALTSVVATGTMQGSGPLDASLLVSVASTGALTVDKPLAGSVSGASALSGGLGGASALLTATTSTNAAASAALTVPKALAGDVYGVAYADGYFAGDTPNGGRLHRRSLYFF